MYHVSTTWVYGLTTIASKELINTNIRTSACATLMRILFLPSILSTTHRNYALGLQGTRD